MVLGLSLLAMVALADDPGRDWKPPGDWPEGWYARIETPRGRIVVQLHPEQAPQSVAHFVALAEGKLPWTDPVTGEEKTGRYYDNAPVNRSIGATMFQVGERSSADTFAPFVYVPALPVQPINFNAGWRMGNVRVGTQVSAARWLITAGAMPGLNRTVPCFGTVVLGQEAVFQLTSLKTHPNEQPIDDVRIQAVRVFSVGAPPPLEEPIPYFEEPSMHTLDREQPLREREPPPKD
jgi:peptidyl-prolyl cis-trans isomerase A (cyclophilin A)